ncbi:MAG: septum formation initiator family protein [Verrucomicrobiota bacterium]
MSDRFLEHQEPAPQPVWVSLNRLVAALIVALVASTLVVRYLPETSRRNEIQARIQDLETKAAQLRGTLQQHERQERLLRTSPEYLSLIARDRLDLMQEGETLFRFEAAKR